MIQILIVEDEIPARNSLKKDVASILDGGAVISVAGDGIEALEIASNFRPDILLTDIRMPRMLGTQLAEKVLELYPLCKVIFLSGYSDKNFLRFAIKLGVIDYIEKPIDFEDLKKALTKAVATVQELTSNSHAGDDAILSDLFKSRPAAALPLPQNGSFAAAILSPCTEYTSPIITLIKDTAQKSALNAYCHKKNTGAVEILLVNSGGDIRSKSMRSLRGFSFVSAKMNALNVQSGVSSMRLNTSTNPIKMRSIPRTWHFSGRQTR